MTETERQSRPAAIDDELNRYIDQKLRERGEAPTTRRDRFIVAAVWIGIITFFLLLLRQPADRVHIEEGGGIYIVRSAWWGWSSTTLPARLHGDEWQIRTPAGEWVRYEFTEYDPGDAPDYK